MRADPLRAPEPGAAQKTGRAAGLAAALAATIWAMPALAAPDAKPITDRDPNAVDVAKTPITDLNVGRDDEIPAILLTSVANPYSLDGLTRCRQISTAITDLDQVLGPDIDLPQEGRERISAGRVGKWVVSSFIPFRGLIREVSGANEQDRRVNAAIQAGLTRRGFLKGVGETKGCKYPASPAPAAVVQARLDEMAEEKKKPRKDKKADKAAAEVAADEKKDKQQDKGDVAFKSEPDAKQPAPNP